MSDDNNSTPTPAAPAAVDPTPQGSSPMIPKHRLDEVIGTRNTLKHEREAMAAELADMKSKFEAMSSELAGAQSGHEQELHLVTSGFTDPSVRRFFKREYAEAMREVKGDKPAFDAWLDASRGHALYSPHFPTPAAPAAVDPLAPPSVETSEQRMMRMMQAAMTNPNNGATQPSRDRKIDYDGDTLRKIRAKNGGGLGNHTADVLQQWRDKGIIK